MSPAAFKLVAASWLRERRMQCGLSQRQVADGVGVSRASISGWEQGTSEMGASSERRLKAFFKAHKPAASADTGARGGMQEEVQR